jgi:hypothetical protein
MWNRFVSACLFVSAAWAQSHREFGSNRRIPEITTTGVLVDGGCIDRSKLNLARPPLPVTRGEDGDRENPAASVSAKGVTVNQDVVSRERADILGHLTPEMRNRQTDATCAITAASRAFALLTTDGRLLDLDSGGVTLAMQAMMSTKAGRAMMDGTGPAIKPEAELKGYVQKDNLVVSSVQVKQK